MPIHRVKGGFKWGSHGHVYPSRAGAARQARAAYAHGYRGDGRTRLEAAKARRYGIRNDSGERKLPVYPPDHAVGMEVPEGGSSCARCEYYDEGSCGQTLFREWNGGNVIPLPDDDPTRYCCDFYEPL